MVKATKRLPDSVQNQRIQSLREFRVLEPPARSRKHYDLDEKRRSQRRRPMSRNVRSDWERREIHGSKNDVKPPVVSNASGDSLTLEVPVQNSTKSKQVEMSIATVLVYFSLFIGVSIALLHVTDFLFEWPFHRFYIAQDIAFFVCGTALAWLSWSTLKDRRR